MIQGNIELPRNGEAFPRKLSAREKDWLFSVLPASRNGYREYREKIEKLFVVGYGRFGSTNLVLGEKGTAIDDTIPSAPVFAIGVINYKEAEVYVLIHEETEGQIEFDISAAGNNLIPEKLTEMSRWSYSDWMPGKNAPGDNSGVREIHIITDKIVLVVAPGHKKIWVYDSSTGINHLIPVTNFYNEVMRIKKIKDPAIALNSKLIFEEKNDITDQDIGSAFLIYNKYWKKVTLDYSLFAKKEAPGKTRRERN